MKKTLLLSLAAVLSLSAFSCFAMTDMEEAQESHLYGHTNLAQCYKYRLIQKHPDDIREQKRLREIFLQTYQDLDLLREELSHLPNIDACINPEGSRFIHLAARRSIEALRVLLDMNADPKATDDLGNTALHYAAFYGSEIVDLLTQHIDINTPNSFGRTPLHEVVINYTFGLSSLSVPTDTQRIINLAGTGAQTMQHLTHKGANINAIDDMGETPLHKAVQGKKGMISFVSPLLALGANPLIKNNFGKTPEMMTDDPVIKPILQKAAKHKENPST